MIDSDLKQYGSDLQALFINIKWQTKYVSDGVKIEDFVPRDRVYSETNSFFRRN